MRRVFLQNLLAPNFSLIWFLSSSFFLSIIILNVNLLQYWIHPELFWMRIISCSFFLEEIFTVHHVEARRSSLSTRAWSMGAFSSTPINLGVENCGKFLSAACTAIDKKRLFIFNWYLHCIASRLEFVAVQSRESCCEISVSSYAQNERGKYFDATWGFTHEIVSLLRHHMKVNLAQLSLVIISKRNEAKDWWQ